MSTKALPDNLLRLMSATDRRAIKQMTAEEAAYTYRNALERTQHAIYANWLTHQKWYEEHGIHFHDDPSRRRTGHRGDPDFQVLFLGRSLFLEFKTPTGALTGEQIECHSRLLRSGHYVHVPRSAYEAIKITREWRERVARRAAQLGNTVAREEMESAT